MTGKNPEKATDSQDFRAEIVNNLSDIKTFLSALSASSRWFHIFYLLGPLFLLIERSPADFWLSLCGLVFFGRCMVVRDWEWLRHFWVRACLAFGVFVCSLLPYPVCQPIHWERRLFGYVFRSLPLQAASGWQKVGK